MGRSAFFGAAFFVTAFATNAFGQILNTNDIEATCRSFKTETHRTTIVYVDLSSIKQGEDEWGYTILKKLELAPRERLTVLSVNPSTFEVVEVFDLCYPTFTQPEIQEIRGNRSLWDKLIAHDPQTQQRDNVQTFDARLRNSLDKIVASSKKYAGGKRRNVLGAIAVDKNRFTNRDAVYRLIIFTNGIISDDLESTTSDSQVAESLTKKYPTSFSGAEVSVYGVTGGDRGETLESKGRVFSSFFLSNWARIRSFSSSLPQQTGNSFTAMKTRSGTFDGGGVKGAAKLSLATSDGKSANIWLTFTRGPNSFYLPLDGNYSCSGEACAFAGRVTSPIPLLASKPYFREGDQVDLRKSDDKLVGTLKSESKEIFQGDAGAPKPDEVKYQLEFGLN
jgi:hypothetical protein